MIFSVCLTVKPVGEPDAGDRHVRFDERGMGNGALPNGPSYRAHPRLYLKGPSTYACQCLLIGHDQTCRGPALTAEFDPFRTLTAAHGDLVDHLVGPEKERLRDRDAERLGRSQVDGQIELRRLLDR